MKRKWIAFTTVIGIAIALSMVYQAVADRPTATVQAAQNEFKPASWPLPAPR